VAGANDLYPDWVLCGSLANWRRCHSIAYMVARAEASAIPPILADIPTVDCPDPNGRLRRALVPSRPGMGALTR
jgi:hypothetical protein